VNLAYEFPEQGPVKRGRNYAVLLIVLLDSLLVLALIFFFPLFTGSAIRRLTSYDWSGYVVASDLNAPQALVTGINASWIVPVVSVSEEDSYSAIWIGIGGQFDSTLIQAGTEQDSVGRLGEYSAWYELLRHSAVTIDSLNISSGDRITASISLLDSNTNRWSIEIHDGGQVFKKNVVYPSSMLSADWIVERPTVNNQLTTLANFGEITLAGCTATIGGKVGNVSSFPSIQVTMYNRQNTELTSVSLFTSKDSSFTVNYLS
jgi:hypothetical protein